MVNGNETNWYQEVSWGTRAFYTQYPGRCAVFNHEFFNQFQTDVFSDRYIEISAVSWIKSTKKQFTSKFGVIYRLHHGIISTILLLILIFLIINYSTFLLNKLQSSINVQYCGNCINRESFVNSSSCSRFIPWCTNNFQTFAYYRIRKDTIELQWSYISLKDIIWWNATWRKCLQPILGITYITTAILFNYINIHLANALMQMSIVSYNFDFEPNM